MRNVCEQFLQIRGIVYPRWCKLSSKITAKEKVEEPVSFGDREKKVFDSTDANNNEKDTSKVTSAASSSSSKWIIDKYVYSFSKHIKTPNEIKMRTNIKLEYYEHVRNCPYRVLRELPAKVKIFPPFN